MDGGAFQTSNVFTNVTSGIHSIVVIDTKGKCGVVTLIAHVLRYPHYFTPNGDGYNDTWAIWDLAYQTKARIFIYDRYGKLIKQISPTGQGWDGTYNGEMLPSTDYWFEVFYKLNGIDQEYKSHFSLKR
jgi:gliding motility-associated-like protein